MPASITQGTHTINFQHDVDHQRVKQVSQDGTTLYINAFGVTAELFGPGTGAARWTDYLSIGNAKVGMLRRIVEHSATTPSRTPRYAQRRSAKRGRSRNTSGSVSQRWGMMTK